MIYGEIVSRLWQNHARFLSRDDFQYQSRTAVLNERPRVVFCLGRICPTPLGSLVRMKVSKTTALVTEAKPTAIIVAQGKLLDYIDSLTQRDETPEEGVTKFGASMCLREGCYEKMGALDS